MLRYMKKWILTSFLLCSPFIAYSADVNDPNWQFDIAPYIWALKLDGTVDSGPFTSHISESFSDILRDLEGGEMLWLDAYKGPFGIFLNGLYADLSDKGNIHSYDADLDSNFGLFSGGFSYIVHQKEIPGRIPSRVQIEPYIGARYTLNNAKLTLGDFIDHEDHNWTDPFIGLRIRDDIGTHLVAILAGDIGGINAARQYSYNFNALLGYKPTNQYFNHTTLYLGYRYLYQHYEHGNGSDLFEWRMNLFGPTLGINFSF